MTDPWSNALKEAYASAPTDVVILSTLEFRHPAFIDEEGNNVAARVVWDGQDLEATLEDDASMDAGESVLFQKCSFEMSLPESSDQLPSVTLAIENVTRELTAYLEAAVTQRKPVDVTYREFLAATPEDGPHYVLNGLTLRRASANAYRIEADATFFDFKNTLGNHEYYTRDRFPGLVR